MHDTYDGATSAELAEAGMVSKLRALADQRSLFPHHGDIELDGSTLELSGWMTLRPEDVRSVRHEFTDEYSRFAAGGARGGFPSLGIFGKRGAPLLLDLVDGSRLFLVIGLSVLPGTTKNRQWYPALATFANAA